MFKPLRSPWLCEVYRSEKENHPLYGTHHSKETKEKIGDRYYPKGKEHPRKGRSNYDLWLEKYGKEEANRKLSKYKQECSEKMGGSGNSNYIHLSQEVEKQIISLFLNKISFKSISEKTYISITKIKNFLRSKNLLKVKEKRKKILVNEQTTKEIIYLFKCWKTTKEISDILNLPVKVIKNSLKINGLNLKESKFLNLEESLQKTILDLYVEKQMSPRQICEYLKLSCPPKQIKKLLVYRKIELRNRKEAIRANNKKRVYGKPARYIKLSQEIQKEIVNLYYKGYPPSQIKLKYNFKIGKIYNILRENNVIMRSNSECQKTKNKLVFS
jgi:DNA-binding CsgD family transcriptional regulator